MLKKKIWELEIEKKSQHKKKRANLRSYKRYLKRKLQ